MARAPEVSRDDGRNGTGAPALGAPWTRADRCSFAGAILGAGSLSAITVREGPEDADFIPNSA
ncbi:MAG TPA: hypothetical protein VFW01_00755 [bacterium]|nr:hypothetical protein [bacterium]